MGPSLSYLAFFVALSSFIVAFAHADEYRVIDTVNIADEPACMPAATRAPNGDILVAYSTEWEPFPPGGILKLTRSTDGGKTWSTPIELARPTGDTDGYHLGSGMTTLRDGRIVLPVQYQTIHKRKTIEDNPRSPFYVYNIWDHRNAREIILFESADNGHTWEKRTVCKSPPKHWITNFGRITELKNGQLLLWAYWGKYNAQQTDNEWRAHGFLRSRDGGRKWFQEEMPRPWQSEISPALLADGTLVAIMRHNGDGVWPRRVFGISRSTNNGKTWSEPVPAGVQGKMPDLLVLPGGRVLMGVGAEGLSDGSEVFTSKSRRSFATLFVSDDGCRTWKKDVAFAPADTSNTIVPADSPQLVPLDDGRVFVVVQAIDRSKEGDPLLGYSVGMSLIGNVLEPAE